MAQAQKTALELQTQFTALYGSEEGVIWDLYTSDDKELLEKKLECLISNVDVSAQLEKVYNSRLSFSAKTMWVDEILDKAEKINAKMAEHRAKLLNALWAQRKYNNGDLVMGIIFVVLTPFNDNNSFQSVASQTRFTLHPVFRVRKCRVGYHTANCCAVFLDENGRVYKNWKDYLACNTLPKGIILAPRAGEYKNSMSLEIYWTPEATVAKEALKSTDIVAAVTGMGALVPAVVGVFIPIALPISIGATIAGALSGLWSVGRCAEQLADRDNHEESISMANREARSAWLGVAGGIVGMGAVGASQGLNIAVSRGNNITKAAQIAANSVNIASLTVNCMGMTNSALQIFLKKLDNEHISAMEIMQLSASLVLFTHSVYNYNLVSSFQVSNEGTTMQNLRKMFENAHKNLFKTMANRLQLTGSTTPGRLDVIREPGLIPDNQLSLNVGSFAFNVAESLIKKAINCNLPSNMEDFKSCIFNLVQSLTEDAIVQIFEIASQFLSSFVSEIFGVIPFENVMWRVYKIAKTIWKYDEITGGMLKNHCKIILRKLEEVYMKSVALNNPGRTKCNNCPGYYTIINL